MRITLIFLILIFNIFTLHHYYESTTKAPWEDAVTFIQENSPKNTLILFDRAGSNVEIYKYYSKDTFHYYDLSVGDYSSKLQGEPNFWLVSSRNIQNGDYYINLFENNYTVLISKDYYNLKLRYYQNKILT